MILFFDTETTGLSPGRIIQLSYIMQTEREVRGKNFFFYTSYIEPSAVAVHGFTPEMLYELSNGRTFSMDMDEIYDDFISADLIVAHNLGFDLKFMTAEFMYADRQFKYRDGFCTMRGLASAVRLINPRGRGFKPPKLTELCEHYGIYSYDVSRTMLDLFGALGASHDARYDTAALYLAFNAANDAGDIAKRKNYILPGEGA